MIRPDDPRYERAKDEWYCVQRLNIQRRYPQYRRWLARKLAGERNWPTAAEAWAIAGIFGRRHSCTKEA